MRFQHSFVAVVLALAAVVLAAGCSSRWQSTAPINPSTSSVSATSAITTDATITGPTTLAPGGLLVDQRLGRETRVDRTFRAQQFDPSGALVSTIEVHAILRSTVTGTEEHNGRTYVVESATFEEDGGPPQASNPPPTRQDRSGYFFYQPETPRGTRSSLEFGDADQPGLSADLGGVWVRAKAAGWSSAARAVLARQLQTMSLARSLAGAPGGAPTLASASTAGGVTTLAGPPGGSLSDEVTYLRYPLHPHATWEGLPGFNVWTVEAVGPTPLPIGSTRTARLNIDLPQIFTSEDRATYWYGAPGAVKWIVHVEDEATDQNGDPIGTIVSDEDAVITEYTPGTGDPL